MAHMDSNELIEIMQDSEKLKQHNKKIIDDLMEMEVEDLVYGSS